MNFEKLNIYFRFERFGFSLNVLKTFAGEIFDFFFFFTMFFVSGAQRTGALGRNRIFFESGQKNYARARLGKKKRTFRHTETFCPCVGIRAARSFYKI